MSLNVREVEPRGTLWGGVFFVLSNKNHQENSGLLIVAIAGGALKQTMKNTKAVVPRTKFNRATLWFSLSG